MINRNFSTLPSLPVRVIARLDVKKPNVVKGINLEGLRIVGDPGVLAKKYQQQGVDELIFIDSVASLYKRNTVFEVIENVAKRLRVPFTVGGGINSIEGVSTLLNKGADKVLINTAAVNNPKLIQEAAKIFGSQCLVISIEAKYNKKANKWIAYTDNGRENTNIDVFKWAQEVEALGAGEIFITSIDNDGMQNGFDIDLCRQIIDLTKLPVIVSGGGGCLDDVLEVVRSCSPSGVALGSLLHYGKTDVGQVKTFLSSHTVNVRPV